MIEVVDLMPDNGEECLHMLEGHTSLFEIYQRKLAAWIPTSMSWDELWTLTSKRTSGEHREKEVMRKYKRCIRKGYYCELFNPKEYCKDIYDINHSKAIRQGVSMQSWYQHSVEELKNEFRNYKSPYDEGECLYHYKVWFGVFTKEKKLVGYIALTRIGQFSTYESILGHGDYLHDGIMFFLHFYIQKLIRETNDERFKGIAGTSYWIYDSGREGLNAWKHTAGFCPYKIISKGSYISNEKYNPDERQARPHP
jgi:hypothetical protein